jgi:hypothetical protein
MNFDGHTSKLLIFAPHRFLFMDCEAISISFSPPISSRSLFKLHLCPPASEIRSFLGNQKHHSSETHAEIHPLRTQRAPVGPDSRPQPGWERGRNPIRPFGGRKRTPLEGVEGDAVRAAPAVPPALHSRCRAQPRRHHRALDLHSHTKRFPHPSKLSTRIPSHGAGEDLARPLSKSLGFKPARRCS